MSELIKAILDSSVDDIRHIASEQPELMKHRSASGRLSLDLAVVRGNSLAVVLLMRLRAPSDKGYEDCNKLFPAIMGDISNQLYSSNWEWNIELKLWYLIGERKPLPKDLDPGNYLFDNMDNDTLDDLLYLSDKCSGWVNYESGFLTMLQWRTIYNDWLQNIRASD